MIDPFIKINSIKDLHHMVNNDYGNGLSYKRLPHNVMAEKLSFPGPPSCELSLISKHHVEMIHINV